LAGKTVSIKWYAKQEGILDIRPDALPDYYLVLAGPETAPASSRGSVRPWLIESVYLFQAAALVQSLKQRRVKMGVATSVASPMWADAEVYPEQHKRVLVLTEEQRHMLSLFG
jgi:hypothetical protein